MNALTIREPFASLIMLGHKRIETRSWPAPAAAIGQSIAIHAAKGLTLDELFLCYEEEFYDALTGSGLRLRPMTELEMAPNVALAAAFPTTRGCVVATATLEKCSRVPEWLSADIQRLLDERGYPANEMEFGDFSPGRYGWVLTDVRPLAVPVPARGQQGIWQWEMPECVMTGDGYGRIA